MKPDEWPDLIMPLVSSAELWQPHHVQSGFQNYKWLYRPVGALMLLVGLLLCGHATSHNAVARRGETAMLHVSSSTLLTVIRKLVVAGVFSCWSSLSVLCIFHCSCRGSCPILLLP